MTTHNRRPNPQGYAEGFARNFVLAVSFMFAAFMSHSAAAAFAAQPLQINGFDCALPDCWEEQEPDAGNFTNPQRTEPDGGSPSQAKFFHGDVGGPINGTVDFSDAFTFLLVDGNANGQTNFFDIAVGFDSFFGISLYGFNGGLGILIPPDGTHPPNDIFPAGLFNTAFRYDGLSPGAFIVQIDAPIDPPFVLGVGITSPVSPGGGVAFGSIPEPVTLFLLGVGLAGVGFARRRRLNT